jgi:hypothetical protein
MIGGDMTAPTEQHSEREQARPARIPRWGRWVIGVLVAVGILAVAGPPLIGRFLKSKLEWMVESHLNATLDIQSIRYLPPYTLKLDHADLVTPGPDGKPLSLFSVGHVELKLAEVPRRGKPLVIERVLIQQPEIHLIQTDDGLYGRTGLVKPRDRKPKTGEKPPPKVSEMLRLRHFTLEGGKVTYEDRRKTDTVPLVWRDLNVDLDTQPKSAAAYSYDFTANNNPVATITSSGTFDVDELILTAPKVVLDVQTDGKDPQDSPLPAPLQELLNRFNVHGRVRFTASTNVPLKHADDATFNATIDLADARADHPKWPVPLDGLAARLQATRDVAGGPVSLSITGFRARSGPTTLLLEGGLITVDPANRAWQLAKLGGTIIGDHDGATAPADTTNPVDQIADGAPAPVPAVPAATGPSRPSKLAGAIRKYEIGGRVEFTAAAHGDLPRPGQPVPMPVYELVAYARRASFSLPFLDEPVRGINGGPIRVVANVVTVQNVAARYGYDRASLASVRVPLQDVRDRVRFEEIDLTMAFDRNTPRYPGIAQKGIDLLHPQGPVHVGGNVTLFTRAHHSPRFDYALDVTSDDLSLAVTDYLLPIEHVQTNIRADPTQVIFRTFNAAALDGRLVATGTVATGGTLAYDVQGSAEGVDLRKAWEIYKSKGGAAVRDPDSRVSGKLFSNFRLQNTGLGTQNIKADGEFEILDAEFFGTPVLTAVARAAKVGDGAFVGSEAAGVFDVSDETVHLTHLAVGAPAVGVQGGGSVKFDGTLDLRLIVAPLNDWKDRLKQTGIPLIGNVAGALQSAINTATRTLLYEFAVTGTIKEPKVTPVPVPVLTEGAARIFTSMLKPGEKRAKLLEDVKKQVPTTRAATRR